MALMIAHRSIHQLSSFLVFQELRMESSVDGVNVSILNRFIRDELIKQLEDVRTTCFMMCVNILPILINSQ